MKNLKSYIQEAFRVNQDYKYEKYSCQPKSRDELRKILEERLAEDKNADLNDIDVSKITDMQYLFIDFKTLRSIDISQWDMSNVENTYFMFEGCVALESINITGWDLSKLTLDDIKGMFAGCSKLKEIIGLDTINNKQIQKHLQKYVKMHK